MLKRIFIAFFLMVILLISNSHATLFRAMPLDKLVEEASSAAEVELKTKRSFMNQMGVIFTEYSFSVLEPHNLDNSELDGGLLKLTMIGGNVNGVTSYIEGAPEFDVGEKSFLLLKKVESKIYLSNFTMGKYKIQESEGKTYYISTVFPEDAELGKVAKEKMVDLVRLKFKITDSNDVVVEKKSEGEFKEEFQNKKVIADIFESENREPAQIMNTENPHDGLPMMWFFFALFSVSALSIWWKLKNGTSD